MIYDHAIAAEKLTDPRCVGEENPAWIEGPYISSFVGEPQIEKVRHYCLRISKEFSVAASLVMGCSSGDEDADRALIPLSELRENSRRSEPLVAKMALIEQLEIFRQFCLECDGPCSKKTALSWRGRIDDDVLDTLKELTDRRNSFAHGNAHTPPSIREAVEAFNLLRWIAHSLVTALEEELMKA